jgi:antitoxin HigA-1
MLWACSQHSAEVTCSDIVGGKVLYHGVGPTVILVANSLNPHFCKRFTQKKSRNLGILDNSPPVSLLGLPRLARYFGTSAELWLGMQKDYDLQGARDEFEAEVEREVHPRDKGPTDWSPSEGILVRPFTRR